MTSKVMHYYYPNRIEASKLGVVIADLREPKLEISLSQGSLSGYFKEILPSLVKDCLVDACDFRTTEAFFFEPSQAKECAELIGADVVIWGDVNQFGKIITTTMVIQFVGDFELGVKNWFSMGPMFIAGSETATIDLNTGEVELESLGAFISELISGLELGILKSNTRAFQATKKHFLDCAIGNTHRNSFQLRPWFLLELAYDYYARGEFDSARVVTRLALEEHKHSEFLSKVQPQFGAYCYGLIGGSFFSERRADSSRAYFRESFRLWINPEMDGFRHHYFASFLSIGHENEAFELAQDAFIARPDTNLARIIGILSGSFAFRVRDTVRTVYKWAYPSKPFPSGWRIVNMSDSSHEYVIHKDSLW